ncbi:unnamed protein product, partial [Urochloa humidicola]
YPPDPSRPPRPIPPANHAARLLSFPIRSRSLSFSPQIPPLPIAAALHSFFSSSSSSRAPLPRSGATRPADLPYPSALFPVLLFGQLGICRRPSTRGLLHLPQARRRHPGQPGASVVRPTLRPPPSAPGGDANAASNLDTPAVPTHRVRVRLLPRSLPSRHPVPPPPQQPPSKPAGKEDTKPTMEHATPPAAVAAAAVPTTIDMSPAADNLGGAHLLPCDIRQNGGTPSPATSIPRA